MNFIHFLLWVFTLGAYTHVVTAKKPKEPKGKYSKGTRLSFLAKPVGDKNKVRADGVVIGCNETLILLELSHTCGFTNAKGRRSFELDVNDPSIIIL